MDENAYEMIDTENYDRELQYQEREITSPLSNGLLSNSNININIINGNFNKYVYTNNNSPCKKLTAPMEPDEDLYRPINTEDNLITGAKSLTQNILQGLKSTSQNLMNSSKKLDLHYYNNKKKINMNYGGVNSHTHSHKFQNNIKILDEKPRDRQSESTSPYLLNSEDINYYHTQTQSSVNNNCNMNNSSILNTKTYVGLNTCPNNSHTSTNILKSNINNKNTQNPNAIHVKKNSGISGSINLYKVKNNFSSFIKNINETPHLNTSSNLNNLPNKKSINSSSTFNQNTTGGNYSILANFSINNSNNRYTQLHGQNASSTSYVNYLTAGNNYKNKTRNIISTSSTSNNNIHTGVPLNNNQISNVNKSTKNESLGGEANSMNRKSTPTPINIKFDSLKNKSVNYSSGRNSHNHNKSISTITNTSALAMGVNSNLYASSKIPHPHHNLNASKSKSKSKERENSNPQNYASENLLRYSANSNISTRITNNNNNCNSLSGTGSNLKPKASSEKLEELRKMYNDKLIESIKNRTNRKLMQVQVQSQTQGGTTNIHTNSNNFNGSNYKNYKNFKKSPSVKISKLQPQKPHNSRSKTDLFKSYENSNSNNNISTSNINSNTNVNLNQSKRENLFSAAGDKRIKTLNRLNSFNLKNKENLLTYSSNLKSSASPLPTTPTHINKSASKELREIYSTHLKTTTNSGSIRERLINLKYQSKNFNDYLVKMRNVYGLKKDESTSTDCVLTTKFN